MGLEVRSSTEGDELEYWHLSVGLGALICVAQI